MNRNLAVPALLIAGLFAGVACGQGNRPSPSDTATVTLKGKEIKIAYSRPYMHGRKIMGDLVPYGQVWRTGANEATMLFNPVPLNVGGFDLRAGKCTLWTLPSAGPWKLILNGQTEQWGTNYDPSGDLARVDMQKATLDHPVEQFTISWKKTGEDSADLIMEWETTRVWVSVKAR